MSLLKLIIDSLLKIIFPEFCIGCNKINTLLCDRCFEKLEFVQFKIIIDKKLNPVVCCCYYQTLAKKIIHELKYKSVVNTAKLIAQIIYYSCYLPKVDFITYVPLSKRKLSQRGFNQTKLIAQELGRLTKTKVIKLLKKTKNTKSQMSLSNKQNRVNNLVGSIKINKQITQNIIAKSSSILIIDDVLTTGSTIKYCSKILKKHGFQNIYAACFLLRN